MASDIPPYAELHARSAFSFLDGASSPEALVRQARELGLSGLALVDRDDLGGAVRFHRIAEEVGLQIIHGLSLTLEGGSCLPLLALDRDGWGNLCRLVSLSRTRCPRGQPRTPVSLLEEHSRGLLALTGGLEGPIARALIQRDEPMARSILGGLVEIFGRDRLVVEAWRHDIPHEHRVAQELITMAERWALPWVPTHDVRYARREDRSAMDVLTCLKHKVGLEEAGSRLLPNHTWHLHGPRAMARRWRGHEEALWRTVELAQRCSFDLGALRPELPRFQREGGADDQHLRELVERGAHQRYGAPLSRGQREQIQHELEVIISLGLSGYFLIVWDIVRFAQERDILVQGRGSAANSAVCYCLGITAVDPVEMELLFERFLSRGRQDPPDIDLDIAHQDREEVLQYVYERYGRRHAAMVCETISYRGKSAVRDVANVLGFEPEIGAKLALQVGHCEAVDAAQILALGGAAACGLDPDALRTKALIDVVARLDRLPRHRSIHVGGFVLTAEPLDTIAPLESASMIGRTILQWDKDDLAPVGLVKIDLLGLGILTVIHRTLCSLRETRDRDLELRSIPTDDPAVYAQISEADTVGLFQIESRAQMNSLPRLQPSRFYDLVVQVAIIRPGPIQGEMVHPYIRRRRGEEPVTYLHPKLKPVLERTLGVPLFQEQGMKVAITMAGFTPDQADRLRKIMGFKRATDHLEGVVRELWDGMMERGVTPAVATRILGQLQGFASYGFPESHAASFALLVYASAWLRHHFAPEYLAATLNAQPMGFYGPSTLVDDARRHGVEVRPVDLVFSHWDCTLETDTSPPAVRLGLRLVRGLSVAARARLESAVSSGPLAGLQDLVTRADASGVTNDTLLSLARAGALRTLWPGRREALWALLRRLRERHSALPLHRPEEQGVNPLRPMTLLEETAADYSLLGLSHQVHPMAFHRASLAGSGVVSSADLKRLASNQRVQIAGLVVCRQRPGSAKGVFFLTLEDEHGMMNVVVMPDLFQGNRILLATAPALLIHGVLEHLQGVRNVLGHAFEPLATGTLSAPLRSHDFR